MGMNYVMMIFLTLASGGVSDLLDIIPSSDYWKAKNVHVTEQFLQAELAAPPAAGDITKLIDGLADEVAANREATAQKIRSMGPAVVPQLQAATESGNPEVAAKARELVSQIQNLSKVDQVRKLMAIRAAGEQKFKALLPRLKELEKSDQVFVGDYASAAVAAIEGRPYLRKQDPLGDDVWMLPKGTAAVVHLQASGSAKPFTADDFRALYQATGETPEEQARAVAKAMDELIQFAEKSGNIRLDGVTVGISGDVGGQAGWASIIVHGKYDSKLMAELLPALTGKPPQAFGGVPGMEIERSATLLLPSDSYAAILTAPPGAQQPLDELVAALKAGKGELKTDAEMVRLIGLADTKSPIWGALRVTENFRQAPVLKPFDSIILSGKANGAGVSFKFDGKGANAAAVADAVATINNGVASAKAMYKQEIGQLPPELQKMMKFSADILESIKCASDEKDGTAASLTGKMDGSPLGAMLGMLGASSVRRVHAGPGTQPALPPANPPPM